MDGSVSPKLDSDASEESELKPTETRASKRRKVVEKTVVTVKIRENGGKLKNEGPPPDSWSWRKYGQKPIKGSPYPRGYYRCSTSKGCSAKKQVERCRTDASMLIITYTSSHNHPGPDLHITNRTQLPKEPQTNHSDDDDQIQLATPKEEKLRGVSEEEPEEVKDKPIKTSSDEDTSEEHFHYLQSPLSFPQNIIMNQDDPLTGNLEKTTLGFLLDEEPLSSCPHIMTSSTPKLEENDFFDELEELPISSAAFTSFMRSKFFDEGIPVVPS